MSLVVARMQKMKADNLVGVGNHNQRKISNHSNKDIDIERSHLNYDLVNRTQNYKTDIQKFIDENKSTKRAVRKDAVLVNEWVVTSDKEFFKDKDDKEIKEFFDKSKDFFAEKFGNDNIRYAQVHLDESTPHMHLGIVPFDKDNKLSAKRVFNRQALQDVQDELPTFLQNKGYDIQRGVKDSERKNLTVPEYKTMKDQLNKLSEEKKDIENQLKTEKMADFKLEPVLERKGLFLKKEPSETKIIVDKDELERVKKLANTNLQKYQDYDRVVSERNQYKNTNIELRKEIIGLEKENKKMSKQFDNIAKNIVKVDKFLEEKFNLTVNKILELLKIEKTSEQSRNSTSRQEPNGPSL